MNRYKRIEKKKHIGIVAGVLIIICVAIVLLTHRSGENSVASSPMNIVSKPSIVVAPSATPCPTVNPEEKVYSFLQGPKSWGEQRTWSGIWGKTFLEGGSFGGFGCGLCCMANIYSTITEYKCSPVDMYRYARKVSDYSPSYGAGAICWEDMSRTLNTLGFDTKLQKKPGKYEEFQQEVARGLATTVVVSSYNDDEYWKDTPGHYVTLFLYNAQTDKIFLADSGDPHHNRHWVPLKTIYHSLKTSSAYQYLIVNDYQATKNHWKWNKVTEKWVSNK